VIKLNNREVYFGEFPNKEMNLPLEALEIKENNSIFMAYEDDSDFMKLAMLKGAIDDFSGEASLYLTYMPYSRMDRPNGHYSVSLKAACNLINAMNFITVEVREPHSQVTLDLLNNSFPDNWSYAMMERVIGEGNFESIFFPDMGAKTRYNYLGKLPTAYGKKGRDFLTGKITGLAVSGEVSENVLIVDDLCSRGGTFVEAAKILRGKGAKRIGLLVAYCEHNVYNGEIFDHVDMIYTSSENNLKYHPRITKLN